MPHDDPPPSRQPDGALLPILEVAWLIEGDQIYPRLPQSSERPGEVKSRTETADGLGVVVLMKDGRQFDYKPGGIVLGAWNAAHHDG